MTITLFDFISLPPQSNPFQSWQKRQLSFFVWDLWYSDASKKMVHLYFADKSLRDFLENVPLADLEGIGKYVDENGLMTEQGILKLSYFPFGIHIPYENKYKGYAFGLMNNQQKQMVLTWSIGKEGAWCSEKNYKELLKEDSKDAKEITRIFLNPKESFKQEIILLCLLLNFHPWKEVPEKISEIYNRIII